ncbi:uncharacterized protein LOC110458601 isoform X2 [Mizuhopecten yessoensis]|uniref:uncharacterized protein LOC110458601 isoform X2 n=1 Tax=Mizuhopecten yessoensis TaxID=6573 RepID=UPI000B45F0D5|nr:uncharacterized protein LOC110458601 isoform X2 [Mizuhopecten yessoensis]
MAETYGDGVSIVPEVCDDAVSIVTNTTRNSDETGDLKSPYKSLLGLRMLENKRVLQTDITDKTLSPVLPVQTSTWSRKVDHSVAEDSDDDSVMSESLLRQTQHINNPKSVSEDQASQLLFDDTQSSCDHSGTLPIQFVRPDCQDSIVSPVNRISPNLYTHSPGLSFGDGVGTKVFESVDQEDRFVKSNSPQAKMCRPYSSQSSGEIHSRSTRSSREILDSAAKTFKPRSTPSSEEVGRPSSKAFHASATQSSREGHIQATKVSHSSSDDQAKRAHAGSPQNSGEFDSEQDKVYHATSTRSSGNNNTRGRKLGSCHEQSMTGELPGKCQRIDTLDVLDDKEEKQIFAPQKGHESQSTISPHDSSPAVEHDREEVIFKRIVKQQDYVDKQLRKSSLQGDVEKIKQHMDTLQSLLRQLSNQHKCYRHRLTADVRSTSKTKQDRFRHKREIEQLGKRQKQLIQLVQRQKTLSSRIKDIEQRNDGSGYQTTTTSLSQNLNHQASQKTGSSQMTVTPPNSKEKRVQDTQSSRSSRLTSESCSQSLLLSYTSNIPVNQNTEKMSLPTKSFANSSLIENGSVERPVPRQGGTGTVSANPFVESSFFQQKTSVIQTHPRQKTITTSMINSFDPEQPSTCIEERSSLGSCTHVETRSKTPAQPGDLVGKCFTIQSSANVEEWPAPAQNNRPIPVSNRGGTSPRAHKLTAMSKAGLNRQHFDCNGTPKNVLPNMTSKETFSRTVNYPNIRTLYTKTNAPDQGIKQTSGKLKVILVPPPLRKPQSNTSVINSSSPPPSQHQIMSHGPMFKSPPLPNTTDVDNISPSTASCSDVFPVKSSEINRRIQQRRLLAESQKMEIECEVPVPVLKPHIGPYTKHIEEDQRTTAEEFRVSEEQSDQNGSIPVQTKYPPLRTLIERGALVPENDCLVTESKNGRYIGSLLHSGLIRGHGGEVFKTPVQWVSAVNDGVLVKKSRAYREVFYHGQPLLTFVNPGPTSVIDLTKANEEPESNRAYDGVMSNDAVSKKQAPFDLETLLRNCTVRLISDEEIVPSSDLPENFWNDDFCNVRLPQSLQEQIDCW